MAISKIKQANKKYRHERKRKQKARAEKMKQIRLHQQKVAKKHAQINYIHELGRELQM